jgi:hypothetical protein
MCVCRVCVCERERVTFLPGLLEEGATGELVDALNAVAQVLHTRTRTRQHNTPTARTPHSRISCAYACRGTHRKLGTAPYSRTSHAHPGGGSQLPQSGEEGNRRRRTGGGVPLCRLPVLYPQGLLQALQRLVHVLVYVRRSP